MFENGAEKNLHNTVDYGLDTVGRYIAQSTIPFFRPVLPIVVGPWYGNSHRWYNTGKRVERRTIRRNRKTVFLLSID